MTTLQLGAEMKPSESKGEQETGDNAAADVDRTAADQASADHHANNGIDKILDLFRPTTLPVAGRQGSGSNLRLVMDSEALARIAQALNQSYQNSRVATENYEQELGVQAGELSAMSHRLALMFDAISDGLMTFSEDGELETTNRAARELFELIPDGPAPTFIKQLFEQFMRCSTGPGLANTHHVSLPSGRQIDIEVSLFELLEQAAPMMLVQIHDITERRMTQRRLQEQSFLVENVEGFVLINRPDGIIDWANPYFLRTLGYGTEVLGQLRLADLVVGPENMNDLIADIARQMAVGKRIGIEAILRCGNGRPIWAQLSGFPMHSDDGQVMRYMVTGQDITERKREEQQYVDFCSMVSHELRTPLTVVSGTYEALGSDLVPTLSDPARELLDMGARNCEQLRILVDDIIDINKLEAGKVRLNSQHVQVADPIEESVRAIRQACNDKGLSLRVVVPQTGLGVLADPQRLQQVVTNLLSNAAKFSPPGQSITVSALRRNDTVRIVVEDSGPGVPIDFLPHLFGRFARAQQVQAMGIAGFGLGLSICRNLMVQMGGSIYHEPVQPTGARFIVDLPLDVAPSPASEVVSPAGSEATL